MSNHWYSVLVSLIATVLWTQSGLAEGEPQSSCQKQPFETLCGLSDVVWDQVFESRCEERPEFMQSRTALQGETTRFFILWPDSTWVLSMEYWNLTDSTKDVACIVAEGKGPSALDVPTLRFDRLPTKWIGPQPSVGVGI